MPITTIIDGARAIPISHVPTALRALGVLQANLPSHRDLTRLANDGVISPPLIRLNERFWFCPEPDLPIVAQALGLELGQPVTPPGEPQRADIPRKAA